jgi:hypothetical protein
MKTVLDQVQRFYPKVRRVVDGQRRVRVTVATSDLRGSKKKAPDNCAMARACTRAFALDGAVIRPSVAYFVRGRTATRYRVPQSIYREIVSFDRHGDFRPGEYHLRPVDPAHRVGRHQGGAGKKNRAAKSRRSTPRAYHRTLGIRAV